MIINGDCLIELDKLDKNSIDAIITDPPYELNFLNKGWDKSGISFQPDTWKKCLDVLKPGGYLLAFGGSRTFHRIACAIEDAGFEIRDTLMWLCGSGFPKSLNIGLAIDKKHDVENKWKGWGTTLKPAFEPIIMARKPFKGGCVDNVLKYGVGGININECRIPANDLESLYSEPRISIPRKNTLQFNTCKMIGSMSKDCLKGRFPANVILDDSFQQEWARYFYCSKASNKDRDEGLDEFKEDKSDNGRINLHPTVKPTLLMQYLIRLVCPKGATILDPFMGSGSTGKAIEYENKERNADYKFIGIELDPIYCKIAAARIKYVKGAK